MNRTKIDRHEALEGDIVETEWDIKKIGAGMLAAALLFITGSYILLPGGSSDQSTRALGVSTSVSPMPALPDKEDVRNIITNAKESLSEITADNLTSSQAAIQKVISDLQGLQGKNGAIDAFCHLVCKK